MLPRWQHTISQAWWKGLTRGWVWAQHYSEMLCTQIDVWVHVPLLLSVAVSDVLMIQHCFSETGGGAQHAGKPKRVHFNDNLHDTWEVASDTCFDFRQVMEAFGLCPNRARAGQKLRHGQPSTICIRVIGKDMAVRNIQSCLELPWHSCPSTQLLAQLIATSFITGDRRILLCECSTCQACTKYHVKHLQQQDTESEHAPYLSSGRFSCS